MQYDESGIINLGIFSATLVVELNMDNGCMEIQLENLEVSLCDNCKSRTIETWVANLDMGLCGYYFGNYTAGLWTLNPGE